MALRGSGWELSVALLRGPVPVLYGVHAGWAWDALYSGAPPAWLSAGAAVAGLAAGVVERGRSAAGTSLDAPVPESAGVWLASAAAGVSADAGAVTAGAVGTAVVAAAAGEGAAPVCDAAPYVVGAGAGAVPVDAAGAGVLPVGAGEADGVGVGTAVAVGERVAVTAGKRAGGKDSSRAGAEADATGPAVSRVDAPVPVPLLPGSSRSCPGAACRPSPALSRDGSVSREPVSCTSGTVGLPGSASPSSAWDAVAPVARTSTAPIAAA
jgi:hypothetical protein